MTEKDKGFFDDYFKDESQVTPESNDKAEERLDENNLEDFFDSFFDEEIPVEEEIETIDNKRNQLISSEEDIIEDVTTYLESNQKENIEGKIKWNEEESQILDKRYKEKKLEEELSFEYLLKKSNLINKEKRVQKSVEEDTKKDITTIKEIDNKNKKVKRKVKKRYKVPERPIPVLVNWKEHFYGALPNEKMPVVINPIKDIQDDFTKGIKIGELSEEDYKLLDEYTEEMAYRKAHEDIAKEYEDAKKQRAPSVPKEKRIGLGPLDNEIAMNIPINNDGTTLSDLLAKRNSNLLSSRYVEVKESKVNNSEISNKNEIFKEKEYDIDRYRRIVDKEEDKQKRAAFREILSTEKRVYQKKNTRNKDKRVHRDSIYSKEEILLADSLGVKLKDLYNIMKNDSGYSKKERDRILGIGLMKRTSYLRGGEEKYNDLAIETTAHDRNMLMFLSMFKYATMPILKNIDGLDEIQAEGILQRLKKKGLINNEIIPGLGALWFLTRLGGTLTGYTMAYVTKNNFPSFAGIEPVMGAIYLASYLWKNRLNVLNLDDFPYQGRVVGGEIVDGETLVSEAMIKSSFSKQGWNDGKKIVGRDYIDNIKIKAEQKWAEWSVNGGPSPETIEGNEFLYSLFPEDIRTGKFHNPDLVIQRPRYEDGSPANIAIEVERMHRKPEDYFRTFLSFKEDDRIYEKVIWVTTSRSNAVAIRDGAKMAGMRPGIDYDIVPFITPSGAVVPERLWYLGVTG